MLARCPVLLAFAAFSAIPIHAHAVQPPPSFEEVILRSVVIGKCHAVLTDDDKAYKEVVLASAQAEMNQIWLELIATSTATDTDNRTAAYRVFGEHVDKATQNAETRIKGLDCGELERQTKPVGH